MRIIQEPDGHAFENVQSVWSIYENSFPAHERRTWADYARLCANEPRFVPSILCTQGHKVGLLWYWQFAEFVYLEHFALAKEVRNQGMGGIFLDIFLKRHTNVILEVEPPETSITCRRIGFYQRHGMVLQPWVYTHPGYGQKETPHLLQLMTWPAWSEAQCQAFLTLMFQDILQKPHLIPQR